MTVLVAAAVPFAGANAFFLAAVVASLAAANLRRYAVVIVAVAVLASVVVPPEPGWLQAVTILFTAMTVYGYGARRRQPRPGRGSRRGRAAGVGR
jgi:two-component system sensor histidine kinase DesK